MSEGTAPVPNTTTSDSDSALPSPPKGKWMQTEFQNFQTSMMTDIATLLNHHGKTDLAEAFRPHGSMMTKAARLAGLTTGRWTINDDDLHTEIGFAKRKKGYTA